MEEASVTSLPYIIALDDELDLLEVFKVCMKPKGYEVDIACVEEQFWELIKLKMPSVIFLDIQMPGKQGNDLCKELKANSLTSKIPVIFLSGKDDAHQLAADSCADGCISKPFDSDMVIAEIERIFKSR